MLYGLGGPPVSQINADNSLSCHGQPTVRRLRYSVEMLLGLLVSGMTTDQILADYADLEVDDVLAALEYGALAVGARQVTPLRSG